MSTASPNSGCRESDSIIFSALRIEPVNSSETWFAPELIRAERMIDERIAGAVAQALELVEHHDQVVGHRAQCDQLRVQRLGILLGPHGGALRRCP